MPRIRDYRALAKYQMQENFDCDLICTTRHEAVEELTRRYKLHARHEQSLMDDNTITRGNLQVWIEARSTSDGRVPTPQPFDFTSDITQLHWNAMMDAHYHRIYIEPQDRIVTNTVIWREPEPCDTEPISSPAPGESSSTPTPSTNSGTE